MFNNPTDGPVLIAAAIVIIGLAVIGVALDINRRRKTKEKLRDTPHRREELAAEGGTPLIEEGRTIHIGTPEQRDRRKVPAVSPLGQRVLKAHFAARKLDRAVTTGSTAEIRDAASEAHLEALQLARYIDQEQRARQE